jgi:predicted PurR-regulated permease PerM
LAALLEVIFRPVHKWMIARLRGQQRIAALLTTLVIMLVVLIPLAVLIALAAAEARQAIKTFSASSLMRQVLVARDRLNLNHPTAEQMRAIESDFDAIQQSPTIENIFHQRTDLSHIRLFNKELAESHGLSDQVPESKIATAHDVASLWGNYLFEFQRLRDIQQQLTADAELEDPDEFYHQYLRQAAVTYDEFMKFKTQLLGGKLQTWIKEIANPNDESMKSYGAAAVEFLRTKLVAYSASTTAFVFRFLLGSVVMMICLYFFLLDGPRMVASIKMLSPLNDQYEEELIAEFGKVSRAVVIALLLSAVVQGLLGGIGYYFAGLDSVFLLTLLTACLALVPVFGTAVIWVPCCLWLFFVDDRPIAAIGLGVYGVLVISGADNVIKPLVLHGQSNLHPLLGLLSILGGVATLGPIGIVIGPMIVAFLQTLLKILQREMAHLDSGTNRT